MRVELIYKPGCDSYSKILASLQTVIAEERMPIHVELVDTGSTSPKIRIDGKVEHESGIHTTIDSLSDLLCRKWKEMTECVLAA